MSRKKSIRFDHELTPEALRLVAIVEAREARIATKARRLEELKEAGRRVAHKKTLPDPE